MDVGAFGVETMAVVVNAAEAGDGVEVWTGFGEDEDDFIDAEFDAAAASAATAELFMEVGHEKQP